MNRFAIIFSRWFPLAVASFGICGLIFVAVQQSYRMSLNDPQIEIAEDGATALAAGKQPAEIVPRGYVVDAQKSLLPFIAVYDKDGTPLEASAVINNAPPKPPIGVFTVARERGENRVTWQPDSKTRIALVVVPARDNRGYFVAAGRNMREVEARIEKLALMTGLALFVILIASLIVEIAGDYMRQQSNVLSKRKHS